MLAEMPMHVFLGWLEYYELEPWGEERADLRAASICKMIHDVNVRRGQRNKPLGDFALDLSPREPIDVKSKAHQNKMKMIGAMIAGAHLDPKQQRQQQQQQ